MQLQRNSKKKVHLIAIGGAVMHNLALCLNEMGWQVSGSDDEIREPSKSRLRQAGLLPEHEGWFPEKLADRPNLVILGMHARVDNPELQYALEHQIPVQSFPEFVYELSKDKIRIVVGGSHGKTTSTAMMMHVLRYAQMDFDYLVGSQLEGFDLMVKLSQAPIIIIEGDEYLNSAINPKPKFHFYHAHHAMLTGIAWDHMNVFPTFDNYCEQFRIFVQQLPAGAVLAHDEHDQDLKKIVEERADLNLKPYHAWPHKIKNHKTFLEDDDISLQLFGEHNLKNMAGAFELCKVLGIEKKLFLEAMQSFSGTARRLEIKEKTEKLIVYRDFAHSPSKLKATVEACIKQYSDQAVFGVFELHTFSSLNQQFLPQYKNSMNGLRQAIVYFNPKVLKHKGLPDLSKEEIQFNFGEEVEVLDDAFVLKDKVNEWRENGGIVLLMSSGNFDGVLEG